MQALKGKTAWIIGGSGGIGRDICIELAGFGANIAAGYHSRREEVQKVVMECKEKRGSGFCLSGGFKDPFFRR